MRSLLTVLIFLSLSTVAAVAIEKITTLPDEEELEVQHAGEVFGARISADGNVVAFDSTDPAFIDDDTGKVHVYAWNRLSETFERISLRSDGNPAQEDSFVRDISDDGRFVLFDSDDELVPEDNNSVRDVYVRDRLNNVTVLASFTHDEMAANASCTGEGISNTGRYAVFTSIATNLVTPATSAMERHVFLRDITNGNTILVSQSTAGVVGNGNSNKAEISGNGRYVVFESGANNLLDGGLDTNGRFDIFVRDLEAMPSPTTTRVSLSNTGGQVTDQDCLYPDISSDGRYVSFKSDAWTLVPGVNPPVLNQFQIFVRDTVAATTSHVSRSAGGGIAETRCDDPSISANGRYVIFHTAANNIAPGNSGFLRDVFARDLQTGVTSRVSVTATGAMGNGNSDKGHASDNGTVVFVSTSSNFVPETPPAETDVFTAPADAPVLAPPDQTAAMKKELRKELRKVKKKLRNAKRRGQKSRVRKYKKEVRAIKREIRKL